MSKNPFEVNFTVVFPWKFLLFLYSFKFTRFTRQHRIYGSINCISSVGAEVEKTNERFEDKICFIPNAKRARMFFTSFYLPSNCSTDIKSRRTRTPKQIKMLHSRNLRGSEKLSPFLANVCEAIFHRSKSLSPLFPYPSLNSTRCSTAFP